jgi:hypothetical protein
MKATGRSRAHSAALSAVLLLALSTAASIDVRAAGDDDVLYVGDGADNTVKRFDAETGAFLGTLVKTPPVPVAGVDLIGPRGLIFELGNLLVVNQNVNQNPNGEVLLYSAATGALLRRVVASADPHSPVAPRGIVLWNNHLFVADLDPGELLEYTTAGAFVAALTPPPAPFPFRPRSVVVGPDGLLYVSNYDTFPKTTGLGGHVMQFDPVSQTFVKFFITNNGSLTGDCTSELNRPEGLVFGPDGNLYITSFAVGGNDTDKILVFAGPQNTHPGACIGQIDLDHVGQPRTYAQALLFGPEGALFVPITNLPPDDNAPGAGAVRRYAVGEKGFGKHKAFTNFVPPKAQGGALGQPWYLTFGKTDPGTLAYPDERERRP